VHRQPDIAVDEFLDCLNEHRFAIDSSNRRLNPFVGTTVIPFVAANIRSLPHARKTILNIHALGALTNRPMKSAAIFWLH
jgi:hypothetical protein